MSMAKLTIEQRPTARRKRPLVHLSLSPDAIARLAEIATRRGESRSGVVERLVREAEMPRPRSGPRTAEETSVPQSPDGGHMETH